MSEAATQRTDLARLATSAAVTGSSVWFGYHVPPLPAGELRIGPDFLGMMACVTALSVYYLTTGVWKLRGERQEIVPTLLVVALGLSPALLRGLRVMAMTNSFVAAFGGVLGGVYQALPAIAAAAAIGLVPWIVGSTWARAMGRPADGGHQAI